MQDSEGKETQANVAEPDIDEIEIQLQRIVDDNLAGNRVAIVQAVDRILKIASKLQNLRCEPIDEKLSFDASGNKIEVPVDCFIAKFRMMGDRLAVLANRGGKQLLENVPIEHTVEGEPISVILNLKNNVRWGYEFTLISQQP